MIPPINHNRKQVPVHIHMRHFSRSVFPYSIFPSKPKVKPSIISKKKLHPPSSPFSQFHQHFASSTFKERLFLNISFALVSTKKLYMKFDFKNLSVIEGEIDTTQINFTNILRADFLQISLRQKSGNLK
jgi:hypothetical protein